MYASPTAQVVFRAWPGLGEHRSESPTIGPGSCLESFEKGAGLYWGRKWVASSFYVCQRNVPSGPKTSHRYIGEACWFSGYVEVFDGYTLPAITLSYGVSSLWPGEKYSKEALETSLPFATEHVWHTFSAGDRLPCVWCESERTKHLSWQCWM